MQITCKEEEDAIGVISSISCIDSKIVKKVFEGMAVYSAMEAYRGRTEFVYPYVGKVNLEFYEQMANSRTVTKKAKGTVVLFDDYAETMGLARKGKFKTIVDFVKARFQRTLHDAITE